MIDLPQRPLADRQVSAIGLGCMNLSHAYGNPPSETDAIRLLNHALDLGVTHLDTAALYGGGANERLLGKAVMSRRAEFQLASKCVLDMRDGQRVLDGSPASLTRTLDGALRRLGTDHIDIYYLHRLDRDVPIEESVGTLARAREAGKIGAIGLSEMGATTIRRAHAVHRIAAVQSEYSPISRNVEIAVLDTCRDVGAAFVAFSPVARGFLAGGIKHDNYAANDIRLNFPRYIEPQLSKNLALVRQFDVLAREAGMTSAQLALGWSLACESFLIALPGTINLAHLEENMAARPITPDLVAAVDAIFGPGALAGSRYPPLMQSQVDTETFPNEKLS